MSKVDDVFALICDMNQVELKRLCDLAEGEGLTLGIVVGIHPFADPRPLMPSFQVPDSGNYVVTIQEILPNSNHSKLVKALLEWRKDLVPADARELLRRVPTIILQDVSVLVAEQVLSEFKTLGARVNYWPKPTPNLESGDLRFTAVLISFGANSRIAVMTAVRRLFPELSLQQARLLVDEAPSTLKEDLTLEEVEKIDAGIAAAYGQVIFYLQD